MNVEQLREALAAMPGHLPVDVEVEPQQHDRSASTERYCALECVVDGFPKAGRVALIRINYSPN